MTVVKMRVVRMTVVKMTMAKMNGDKMAIDITEWIWNDCRKVNCGPNDYIEKDTTKITSFFIVFLTVDTMTWFYPTKLCIVYIDVYG